MALFKKKAPPPPELKRNNEPPKEPPHHDESNWLVSYADMMTLLCMFFILMFSMAQMDHTQVETVKESMAKKFGGDYQSPTKEMARFVSQVLDETGMDKEAIIKEDGTGVSVVFQSTVFYDTLSAEVKPQGRILLDKMITAIATRQIMELKKYRIVVEGHTDSRPILGGAYPTNWELSGARASSVVRMFLDKGFEPDRLAAIAYADTRPRVSGRNPAGAWDEVALAKNRRVVLRILEPKVGAIPFPAPEDAPAPGGFTPVGNQSNPASIVNPSGLANPATSAH